MEQVYKIHGMTCNGCRSHVESVLSSVKGVSQVDVNLEQNEAKISTHSKVSLKTFKDLLARNGGHYTIYKPGQKPPNSTKIKPTATATKADSYYCPMFCEGNSTYPKPDNCLVCGMDLVASKVVESSQDRSYTALLYKFFIAVGFTVPIFIIAMSEGLTQNPFYKILEQTYWNWIQFALSIPVVFYAADIIFKRAWMSVKTMHLNMFTLVGLGAAAAWLFSVVALVAPTIFPLNFKTHTGNVFLYFEAATVILTLVLLGQVLEAKALSKTNGAIKKLLNLAAKNATRIESGKDVIVGIDAIEKGDLLRVKPGEKIPVDGKITEGFTSIDESIITGEPLPVDKQKNDPVSSGTINGNSTFIMVAEKVGSETLLSQIIELVNSATRSKAPLQKLADKMSSYFIPIVLGIATLTALIWVLFGPEPRYSYAFVNVIAVLIIACPCALGLATPISVMVGVGRAAQSGVLIKNAEAMEVMNSVNTLIVDKTGTLTEGKPSVEKIVTLSNSITEEQLLQYATSINRLSEHPLASAIVNYGTTKATEMLAVSHFKTIPGKGVIGEIEGQEIAIGNLKLMEQLAIKVASSTQADIELLQKQGKTISFISVTNVIVGYISIFDAIKASGLEAIKAIQDIGITVIMLTGDNKNTAAFVADQLNIKDYLAECLPDEKLKEIKRLQNKQLIVAMAGDGINDAPALVQANVGIAMGTGTDIAIESAGITLIKGNLLGLVKAFKLSKKVVANSKQNLFFAFFYNALGIPVAAGVLYPFFGILLSPMLAALAMSLSSVSVITNALRLRTINI